MFTGIIEEVGTILAVKASQQAMQLTVGAQRILHDVQLGDSIAVNGVCLTVTSFTPSSFTVDVMPESIKATSLDGLAPQMRVNLERAMAANGRFGGHFVSGHVDGIGTIISRKREANALYVQIAVDESLLHYMIPRGSVAVDGTSLTIFALDDKSFTISLIPHTADESVVGTKAKGAIVNIECDMMAKYIEKFTTARQPKAPSRLTASFLQEHGYL